MKAGTKKKGQKARRRVRVRAKIFGTGKRPRLSVFRSNRYVSAQLIDDEKGQTLAHFTSRGLKKSSSAEQAKIVGKKIAEAALGKKIKEVVFDRGVSQYAGKIKALAEGAREGGLKF